MALRLFKDVKSTQTDNFVKRLEELGFYHYGAYKYSGIWIQDSQ